MLAGHHRRVDLSRAEILAFRRRTQGLDARLPAGPDSLRIAARAGLQDSMPRAALLSIHARVEGTQPTTWEDPSLVQVWGPRFSAYVIAAADVALFTLGRLPDPGPSRQRAQDLADRLDAFLGGRAMSYADAGHGLGVVPNELRYATTTGRVLIRWEGAKRPTIWMVPAPDVDPFEARLDLARRYLHVFGPSTADAFSEWAGIKPPRGLAAFDALAASLEPVATPIGDRWILAEDEPAFHLPPAPPAPARLLPSGDTWFLLQGADRELLVPDGHLRPQLWTSRVWPGAVLLDGEIAGTWRRAGSEVDIDPWRDLSPAERTVIEAEAVTLPLPDLRTPIRVRFAR
jgi:hypothetical protein